MWRDRISRTDLPPLVVASLGDDVVGFATYGTEEPTADSTGCGQLHAMNVDPTHWGKGIGRALLREATAALTPMGHREAVLWVVPENTRARTLYESEGWVVDGGISTDEILGVTVTDIRLRKQLVP